MLNHDHDFAYKLLMKQNENGVGTILFAVGFQKPEVLEAILDYALENFSVEQIKEMLLQQDTRGNIAFVKATRIEEGNTHPDGTCLNTKPKEILKVFDEFLSKLEDKDDFSKEAFLADLLKIEEEKVIPYSALEYFASSSGINNPESCQQNLDAIAQEIRKYDDPLVQLLQKIKFCATVKITHELKEHLSNVQLEQDYVDSDSDMEMTQAEDSDSQEEDLELLGQG